MVDGTRTRIHLLRCDTAAVVDALFQDGPAPHGSSEYRLRGTEESRFD
ncbi:hypothetical protein JL475_22945 [Streptomyces sp. M2CJ-2]|nr:hypothetical protein [Streptomyces sp. M2CJ-2]MBL3668800.1 hypothetical protein [Streptomyces sp. M2CJ-2]